MGNSQRSVARPHCPRAVLSARGPHDFAARIYQEDAENTGRCDRFGGESNEGPHMKKKSGRVGASFDDFLKEQGTYEAVTAGAIKRVIARQLNSLMSDEGLTKSELAKRMHTSRAQLDRLLDP